MSDRLLISVALTALSAEAAKQMMWPMQLRGGEGLHARAILRARSGATGRAAHPTEKRFLRCCTEPRQARRPAVMMPIRVHSASHSSMLWLVSSTVCPARPAGPTCRQPVFHRFPCPPTPAFQALKKAPVGALHGWPDSNLELLDVMIQLRAVKLGWYPWIDLKAVM